VHQNLIAYGIANVPFLGKESMLTTVTLTLSEYGQMNILVRWS
jgi:uncharacterized membrane protein YiaA